MVSDSIFCAQLRSVTFEVSMHAYVLYQCDLNYIFAQCELVMIFFHQKLPLGENNAWYVLHTKLEENIFVTFSNNATRAG